MGKRYSIGKRGRDRERRYARRKEAAGKVRRRGINYSFWTPEAIWQALGDVEHYVEPFCGGLAALLHRPHEANRTYHSETVNDLDGLLVNAWRSIQMSPNETADAASWPVSEADLHARHIALVRWRAERQLEHLMGDPAWHDPVMGGWWLWGQSCWIGSGWCSGTGVWTVDASGRIYRQPRARSAEGVHRQLPHLSDDGRGVNRPQAREPGVDRQLPHLSDDGRGVNRPQAREPGTEDAEHEYHPMTMPELRRWFRFLSARLRHVRILNGDWRRACTDGAVRSLSVRQGGVAGVFLDPPYADTASRMDALYAHDSLDVAHDVREWCLRNGDRSDYRIVLAGFAGEHGSALVDAGWREVAWFASGFLTGGMANTGDDDHQQAREAVALVAASRALDVAREAAAGTTTMAGRSFSERDRLRIMRFAQEASRALDRALMALATGPGDPWDLAGDEDHLPSHERAPYTDSEREPCGCCAEATPREQMRVRPVRRGEGRADAPVCPSCRIDIDEADLAWRAPHSDSERVAGGGR